MSVLGILAVAMSLVAAGWALRVQLRMADARIGFLFGILALLALSQSVFIVGGHALEEGGEYFLISAFGTSLLAILAVYYLRRIIREHRDATRQTRIEKAYYEQLFEASPEAVVVLDEDDRVVRVNGEFTRLFGYSPGEATGRTINELIVPDYLSLEGAKLTGEVADGKTVAIETRRRHKDGSLIDVSILGTPVRDESGQIAVYGIYRDITQRKSAERALRESEERYALAAHAANDGLWEWNVADNRVYYSPRWKSMLGYEDADIGDSLTDWFQLIHEDDAGAVERAVNSHVDGHGSHFQVEYRALHKDGTYRWMLTRGAAEFGPDGRPRRIAGSQSDITDRKLAEEQLLYDALHDSLTNFPNRTLFMDRVERSISLSKRQSHLLGVLVLDFDRFKMINDSLGHMIGDQFIIAIAARLQNCLRPGDTVARLGGDEFAILLDGMSEVSDAIRVANRIFRELELPFSVGGHEVFTTVSVGIVVSASRYRKAEELLRDADIAMHRVKARGGNGYELFDSGMHSHVVGLLQLEGDLRRAIERGEFSINYQPIIRLEDGELEALEVLLRWNHPDRGTILPSDFIFLAEETGMIVPIGKWILSEACREAHRWIKMGYGAAPAVSVNLSARQFLQADLLGHIKATLNESGLDPRRLHLEITESVLMDHAEANVSVIRRLKELGLTVLVDDFGTGYSSLSYLHRFDVDTLKIDRSFIAELGTKRENREIVRTVVELGRNLGLGVVAEGVETEDQLEILKSLKCAAAQGNYFSEPMPADRVQDFLEAQEIAAGRRTL